MQAFISQHVFFSINYLKCIQAIMKWYYMNDSNFYKMYDSQAPAIPFFLNKWTTLFTTIRLICFILLLLRVKNKFRLGVFQIHSFILFIVCANNV